MATVKLGEGTVIRAKKAGIVGIGECVEGDVFVFKGTIFGGKWQNVRTGNLWNFSDHIDNPPTHSAFDDVTFVTVITEEEAEVLQGKKKAAAKGLKNGDVFCMVSKYNTNVRKDPNVYLFLNGRYWNLGTDKMVPASYLRIGYRWKPRVIASIANTGAGFSLALDEAIAKEGAA